MSVIDDVINSFSHFLVAYGIVPLNFLSLTSLDFESTNIHTTRIIKLSEALKTNQSLVSLNLENNAKIGPLGIEALAQALEVNCTLTTLKLKLTGMEDNGAMALGEMLKKNSKIISLNLSLNGIKHDGAKVIADALSINNNGLRYLNLSFNPITDRGIEAIALSLKTNTTLTMLNLTDTQMNDAGAQAIAEALAINKSLTTLILNNNHITSNGARAIADALKTNQTLATLAIHNNSIGDEGAEAFATALLQNYTLKSFVFLCNNITEISIRSFSDLLKSNFNPLNLPELKNLPEIEALIEKNNHVHLMLTTALEPFENENTASPYEDITNNHLMLQKAIDEVDKENYRKDHILYRKALNAILLLKAASDMNRDKTRKAVKKLYSFSPNDPYYNAAQDSLIEIALEKLSKQNNNATEKMQRYSSINSILNFVDNQNEYKQSILNIQHQVIMAKLI